MIFEHLYDYLGGYMFLALAVFVMSGYPVALVLGGLALLFAMGGIGLGLMSTRELYLFAERAWQTAASNQLLVAVPCYIFMGLMLERSRAAENLLKVLQLMLRRVPGGLALAVTLLGTILAATTGIIGASVVMLTTMAMPVMLQQGYSKSLASGTIAASATLGILLPPSVMLVMMADLMQLSVGDLFLGAILPGLLLSGLYCIWIIFIAAIKPELAPPVKGSFEGDDTALVKEFLTSFLPIVFLISLVLGSIFAGWATPTEAAGIGAFGATMLALWKRQLSWKVLDDVCQNTALTTGMIFLIMAAATAFSYVFRALYGEDLIIDFIRWMDMSHWSLLVLILAVVFVLGFFFDWLEITLIILPVFAPVVAKMAPEFAVHLGMEGMSPAAQKQMMLLWFAILVSVNLQTSFLTPPFGFALFFLKGTAPKEVTISEIYKGIVPFVGVQLFGLLLVVVFPWFALALL